MSADDAAIVIDRLDHLVLTVREIEATCRFYGEVLGMRVVRWEGRTALQFGQQKINLHQAGSEFEPKAKRPTPGSGDFCLITKTPLAAVMRQLAKRGVAVEQGPVPKQGALGPMRSVYFRDPDDNLVEVSNYP
jgi:catechol 2,3-dioxygenase-like lactoylglutathione lyase family enzyme